jgi:hypothetical protein
VVGLKNGTGKAFDVLNTMNKIIPICPKCQKPITYVNQGYLTAVESGGPSYDCGAIAFACPECRTLLGVIPDLPSQIGEVESLVQGLPDQLGQ